mmetsp:Transcript_7161/g.15635  ORF Transcript_7161/g.15635 Transcript_7161/m.15635 type:complete len:85 (+) Transcript_7161:1114-1368(+)
MSIPVIHQHCAWWFHIRHSEFCLRTFFHLHVSMHSRFLDPCPKRDGKGLRLKEVLSIEAPRVDEVKMIDMLIWTACRTTGADVS